MPNNHEKTPSSPSPQKRRFFLLQLAINSAEWRRCCQLWNVNPLLFARKQEQEAKAKDNSCYSVIISLFSTKPVVSPEELAHIPHFVGMGGRLSKSLVSLRARRRTRVFLVCLSN